MLYPKDSQQNLLYRANLLEKAKTDTDIQAYILKECQNDILFFFNVLLFTYDPRLDDPAIPFITYPFQDKYIQAVVDCVRNEQDNITEKSRDMWYSRMILWILLWWFLFHKRSSLIGSYKEDYVDEQWNMDSSFERLRYMLNSLPSWMKPQLEIKYMSISDPARNCEIAGDAWRNFGTGWRRKVVFMDEFAIRPADSTAFRKTRDITKCRIIGWTPEGTANVYGKIMTNHIDYRHLQLKKYRLLRKLHPNKTEERYENEKKNRLKIDIAKEIDISYDDSVTGAVYTHFKRMVNISYYPYNPELKLYRSFDSGRDSNVCIRWQKDYRTDMLYIINSVKRIDRDIRQFWALVTGKPIADFVFDDKDLDFMETVKDYKRSSWDFGDPYNSWSTTTNATSSIEKQLREFWIYLQWNRKTTVEERIRKTTLALDRIRIDNAQMDLIASMIQSKYVNTPENSQLTKEKTKPLHDDNSHFRTAFEYFVDNEPIGIQDLVAEEVDYSEKLY